MSWDRVAGAWHTREMRPAQLAAPAAVLGGVLWIAHALLGAGSDPLASTLYVVGLVCVLAGAAIFGSSLVRSDARGMRVVVGLASGLLALSLIESFRPGDSPWYDGLWGMVAVLVGGLSLLRARGRSEPPGAGTHSH